MTAAEAELEIASGCEKQTGPSRLSVGGGRVVAGPPPLLGQKPSRLTDFQDYSPGLIYIFSYFKLKLYTG